MKIESNESKEKISRYKRAIIKLNNIAKVVKPIDKKPESVEPQSKKMKNNNNYKKKKCKYESRGSCKDRRSCPFFHPTGTCARFQSYGVCELEERCQERHPSGLCFEWQKKGRCDRDTKCKFQHPFSKKKDDF